MNNLQFSTVRPSWKWIIFTLILVRPGMTQAQERMFRFTLDDVIQLAQEQSPMAIMSRHRFRGSYWEYRTHKAKFRPGLNLTADLPDLTRSIERNIQDDGSEAFVPRSTVSYAIDARLNQNIAPTGGSVFIRSGLERIDRLGEEAGPSNYLSTPISIGIRQPIKAHNSFRWERKIEPLKYEAAEKTYLEDMENVSRTAVNYFFDLALSQVNLQIAEQNYNNNDTIYKIAQGRYNIGTIAENELLQMELAFLNAGTDLNQARIQLEVSKFTLRSFLGYNETVDIELIIPSEIPDFDVEVTRALEEAQNNNPTIIDLQRQLLEADQSVAEAKAELGFTADLFASYGLTQRAPEFANVYRNPQDQQRLSVGVEVPLVDWGLNRGQFRMAESNQEVVKTNVAQAEIDFEQEVMLQVMQFNLQDDQLRIAAKADTVAQKRFNVAKERFYIGNIDVLDLNVAQTDKDAARRNYLSALLNYWSYYFNIRRLTLYDFERMQPLSTNVDQLLIQ